MTQSSTEVNGINRGRTGATEEGVDDRREQSEDEPTRRRSTGQLLQRIATEARRKPARGTRQIQRRPVERRTLNRIDPQQERNLHEV